MPFDPIPTSAQVAVDYVPVYDHRLGLTVGHSHVISLTGIDLKALGAVATSDFTAYTGYVETQLTGKLDSSVYATASGAWQSTYATVAANSAQWAVSGTSGASSYADLMYVSGQVSGKLPTSVFQAYTGHVEAELASFSYDLTVLSGLVSGDTAFVTGFTSADVQSGMLTLAHNLGQRVVSVVISDNGYEVKPNEVNFASTSSVVVDLAYMPVTGSWTALVIKGAAGGGTVIVESSGKLDRSEFQSYSASVCADILSLSAAISGGVSSSVNIDGGFAASVYGGVSAVDGGGA